jgi:hypothetical protein
MSSPLVLEARIRTLELRSTDSALVRRYVEVREQAKDGMEFRAFTSK